MKFEFENVVFTKPLPTLGQVVMLKDYVDNPFMLLLDKNGKFGFVDLTDGRLLASSGETVEELMEFVGDWTIYPNSKVVLA